MSTIRVLGSLGEYNHRSSYLNQEQKFNEMIGSIRIYMSFLECEWLLGAESVWHKCKPKNLFRKFCAPSHTFASKTSNFKLQKQKQKLQRLTKTHSQTTDPVNQSAKSV